MQAWINNTEDIRLQVAGYSCLVEVQIPGHPRNKLASLVQQWNMNLWPWQLLAYCHMYNGNFKDLGVRHNMIHELIMNGVVSILFVRSQQYLADQVMKGLARDLVIKSTKGMGLKSNLFAE
ncbi:hypothetical protein Tco_0818973 [Tanacetum coccineum]